MDNPSDKSKQAGSKLPVCLKCGRTLTQDEIGLTRKMINRGAEHFFCLSCLACHFDVSEDILLEKIRQFREMGCTLFPSPDA